VSVPFSIADAIAEMTAQLSGVSESARLDAEILIARAIDMPRSYLYSHPEDVLDDAAIERLQSTVTRRLSGEPMAYISGTKEFWSLELMVSPATLVPRPETELLVDLALRCMPRRSTARVLDLGTGSGAIALAIAHDRPSSTVTATDISAAALAVARQNARQHEICNITFLEGDWTAPVAGQHFDIIVSNPPYVADGDSHLRSLGAEPEVALTPGPSGLEAIETIAGDCRGIIAEGGTLLLEHGADQRDGVAEILHRYGWHTIQCYDDGAGLPRATGALFNRAR
jgi:release factor glutamine methyltransferase